MKSARRKGDSEERVKKLEQSVFGASKEEFVDQLLFAGRNLKREIGAGRNEDETPAVVAAAWEDSDEEERQEPVSAQRHRRPKLLKTVDSSWADVSTHKASIDSDDEDDLDLSKTAVTFTRQSNKLQKDRLVTKVCTDLNKQLRNEKEITAIEFHRTEQIAFIADRAGKLNLFRPDGEENRNVASLDFEQFPILHAQFNNLENSILLTSQARNCFVYNLSTQQTIPINNIQSVNERYICNFVYSPCGTYLAILGQHGRVYVLHSRNLQLLHKVTLNYFVRSICFSQDSAHLNCLDEHGTLYIYALQNLQRCVRKFQDEGNTKGTSISASPNETFLATGSISGVVNLYDYQSLLKLGPGQGPLSVEKPAKSFKNLITGVDCLHFNSTCEFVTFASPNLGKAIRIAHLQSTQVFPNFPPASNKGLGMIKAVALSPNSKFLAIGNKSGKAFLYSLPHFTKY